MAALRAAIMQMRTRINLMPYFKNTGTELDIFLFCNTPKQNPITAKGMAKMVWENFTRDR